MKKNTFRKLFVVFVFLPIVFCGCEKDDFKAVEVHRTEQIYQSALPVFDTTTIPEINRVIEHYSYIVAKSMVNRSFRSLIKENAMLMFDGDYDVLAVTLHDMILTGGEEETVEQLLVKEYEALPDKYNGMSGNEFLQYALLNPLSYSHCKNPIF